MKSCYTCHRFNIKSFQICTVKNLALSKYRTVGHGIVLYMSVQTRYSDSVQAWYSISFLSKYSTLKIYMKSIELSPALAFKKCLLE